MKRLFRWFVTTDASGVAPITRFVDHCCRYTPFAFHHSCFVPGTSSSKIGKDGSGGSESGGEEQRSAHAPST